MERREAVMAAVERSLAFVHLANVVDLQQNALSKYTCLLCSQLSYACPGLSFIFMLVCVIYNFSLSKYLDLQYLMVAAPVGSRT
jgi:hypothetical protein